MKYCGNQFWLAIYTFITAAILPTIVNVVLNTLIVFHVRSSTRRVHVQMISTTNSNANNQHAVVSHRDLALLRHMIFMFSMFVGGWTPVMIINILNTTMDFDFKFVQICVIFSQVCVLGIAVCLFIYNRELRKYFADRVRICCHR